MGRTKHEEPSFRKPKLVEKTRFLDTVWGMAILVFIIVFLVFYAVVWFVTPSWVQARDSAGSLTGQAKGSLVFGWSLLVAAVSAAIFIIYRYVTGSF
jgi:hypothetical protein